MAPVRSTPFASRLELQSFGQDFLYEAAKALLSGLITKVLVETTISGQDRIPADGPALVVANHRTMLDPFLLSALVDRRIHYVVASFLSRLPLSSRVMAGTGNILLPVSKGGRSQALMRKARRLLHKGRLVGVFPEGVDNFVNASPVGSIGTFHSTFARLLYALREPELPVVPVHIGGEEETALVTFPAALMRVLDPHNPSFRDGEIRATVYRNARIRVGDPLYFTEELALPEGEAIPRIVSAVRGRIVELGR